MAHQFHLKWVCTQKDQKQNLDICTPESKFVHNNQKSLCSIVDEEIKQTWCTFTHTCTHTMRVDIHNGISFSVKRKEILLHATTQMNLENIGQRPCDCAYMEESTVIGFI